MNNNKIKYTVYILHGKRLFNISTQGTDSEQNVWKLSLNEKMDIIGYCVLKRNIEPKKYEIKWYYNNRFFQSLNEFYSYRRIVKGDVKND